VDVKNGHEDANSGAGTFEVGRLATASTLITLPSAGETIIPSPAGTSRSGSLKKKQMKPVTKSPKTAMNPTPSNAKTAVAKADAKMNGYPAFATGNAV
jgi:hypothetical protein